MNRVDQALQQFTPDTLSARLLSAIYGVVPFAPPFNHFLTVDDALRTVKPDALAPTYTITRALADSKDEIGDILWAGRLMDTGDKGYAMFTGLKSVFNLMRGQGAAALDNDEQQKKDAVLKALAIAYIVYKAYPGSMAEKAQAFAASPAGRALAIYYAVIEVALPFADNAAMGSGNFLQDLIGKEGASQASKLASMASGHDLGGAQQMLTALTGQLNDLVNQSRNLVKPVAAAAVPFLGGMASLAGRADQVAGVVAGAADVLPVYNLLTARLAAETAARLATTQT